MALQRKTDRAPQMAKEAWFPMLPLWRSFDELFRDGGGHRMVAVEEFTEDHTLVVRAEMPGIDPAKDVEITIADGMLNISAERTEEEEKSGRHFHRRELRYGSFSRSLSIPEGVDEDKIAASYKDGMLEVRVPLPASKTGEEPHRVEVTRG